MKSYGNRKRLGMVTYEVCQRRESSRTFQASAVSNTCASALAGNSNDSSLQKDSQLAVIRQLLVIWYTEGQAGSTRCSSHAMSIAGILHVQGLHHL